MRTPVLLAAVLPLMVQAQQFSQLFAEGQEGYVVQYRDEAAARRAASAPGISVIHHPDLLPGQLIIAGGRGGAARLARGEDIVRVFPASPELLRGERVTACAGALVEGAVAESFSLYGNGWPAGKAGAELNYRIANSPGSIPLERTAAEIQLALAEWARHANIRFLPAVNGDDRGTIDIRFARGSHGDSYPFDGAGRVLAHTFYPSPPNPEPLAGDMHLDADETWGIGENTDIFTVVLHELGHALGIGHSDRPGAVMYPYYRSLTELSSDDIEAVQSLYGAREQTPASTTPGPLPLRISVTSSNPETTTGETISLAGRVEGGTQPAQVRWESDRGGAGPALGASDWRIESVPLLLGQNRIMVSALDAAGAAASHTVSITRTAPVFPLPDLPPAPPQPPSPPMPDAPTPQPPSEAPASVPLSIALVYPTTTIIAVTGPSITFRGSASGASRVGWTTSTGSSGDATGLALWTAEIPLLFGTNTVTISAVNDAGERRWRSVTVVRR